MVVDGDVIHLANRELHAMEAAAVHGGDVQAAVIGDHEAIGILRIDPDVVVVAAPGHFLENFAAIERFEKAAIGDIHFVIVASGNRDANVIASAADQLALIIDSLPVFAGVVRTPKRALIFRLYQSEVAVGICRRDGHVDFAQWRLRQAVAFKLRPFGAAVF